MTDGAATAHKRRSNYFARTALIMLAAVLLSFPLTYYARLITGSRHFAPLYHIHGAALFLWIGVYAWQTRLTALGRVARHRELGLMGLALSGAIVPLGVAMAVHAIAVRIARHAAAPFETAWYNLCDIGLFGLFMIASITAITRHIEWHRRWTYAAALCLTGPAISRWLLPLPELFPWTDFSPNIVADLLLIPLAVHDRMARGRVHGATLWAAGLMAPLHLVSPWIAKSAWWASFAPGLFGFG